ncbi:MAG: hypothetical protein ACFFBP_12280 [Promethearchaeota archaeon]
MGNSEYFIKRVYELIGELKIPLIDEIIYDDVKIKSPAMEIKLNFEQDEAIIRGFLGLADYFHSIVLKKKDRFYIPQDDILFTLESN